MGFALFALFCEYERELQVLLRNNSYRVHVPLTTATVYTETTAIEYMTPLVLKARHLSGSAFCMSIYIGVPEQALGWLPLDWDWL